MFEMKARAIEIKKQTELLNEELMQLAKQEIEEIKIFIAEHNLTAQDLGLVAVKKPAPIKYRNPETGMGWSGRGKPPTWIIGQNRENYTV